MVVLGEGDKMRPLQIAREEAGKTQVEVASTTGISVVAYQRYEYGMRQPPVGVAIRIAEAVGATDFEQFKKLFYSPEKSAE